MSKPVVLITGAAGGIGSATARRFAQGGWQLALTDLDPIRLETTAHELADAAHWVGDIRTRAACLQLIEQVTAHHGRLDGLVNAAGVWREGDIEHMSQSDIDLVLDVNLKGTLFMCAAAIPHLRQSAGCIVNVSSDAGIQGNLGAAVYCASKGGVSIFTKALALELAAAGVRVNAVCPGDVDTPMLQFQADTYGNGDPQAYRQALLAKYPQGATARFIRPEEVAELIWFLAQPSSAAITGANISIDFGLSVGK